MRRGLLAAVLILFALITLHSEASAQMRRYSCGGGAFAGETVTVTDIADRMLSAGPLHGKTYKFRQSTNDSLNYISGNYILRFTDDQAEIEIIHRDVASVACTYEISLTAASYNTDARGCPPGTRPAPQARTCSFVLSELLANWLGKKPADQREALQPGRREAHVPD